MAANYRIVAELDPSGVAAGKAKVKQDLREIDQAANATKSNIGKAFSGADLDRAMTQLVARLNGLETVMEGVNRSTQAQSATNTQLATTLDRLAGAYAKAQPDAAPTVKMTQAKGSLHAATMRVLGAVDAEAAEQLKLNALLTDAATLYAQGAITAEQYARVQAQVAGTTKNLTQVTGSQRIGMQQLGFQLGDVATMYSLGAKPSQIFASQIGQVSQALMLMGDGTSNSALGRVASFLSGPWGIALTLATIVIGPLIGKIFETNSALDDAVDKLKKDAAQTAIDEQAKVAFTATLEGVTEEIRINKAAMDKMATAHKTGAERTLESAKASRANIITLRSETEELVKKARAILAIERASDEGFSSSDALAKEARIREREAALDKLEKSLSTTDENISKADAAIARAASFVAVEAGNRTKGEQIERDADLAVEAARQRAVAEKKTTAEITVQTKAIRDKAKADKDAWEASQRQDKKKPSTSIPGVPTFKSRRDAVGVAGRELQGMGLRVSEGLDFGGITPGTHKSSHVNAVDVNKGKGITEADVPDLRAKFDSLARSYQKRGYKVLWNGKVYSPGGNGPSYNIPAGDHQHRDHIHLEAPQTIVGKPTQSSTAAFEEKEMNTADQQADFVGRIEDQAATRGLPQAQTAKAELDKVFADYKRRFDEEMSPDHKERITKALTEAEAREIAQHFKQAYVDPLEQLRKLEGLVGQERQIKLLQLEEEKRLERELTDAELKQIEASVKDGDALLRKAGILQEVKGPLDEYKKQIAALNELLAAGSISQTQYNARIKDIAATAAGTLGGVSGIDPNTGKSYEDIAKTAEEDARYANQLAAFETQREALLKLGIDYDHLVEQAAIDHQNKIDEINAARKDMQLQSAQDIAGSLLQITEDTIGKSNALYKGLFVIEKAIAIARAVVAIQTGIAQAASLPFPANLAAIASVAAATASIVSNISAVSLNLAAGGWVRGPGGPTDDRVPVNASNGEFVVRASAARQNAALLEAINDGRMVGGARQVSVSRESGSSQRARISVHNYAGAEVAVRESPTTGEIEVMIERGVARHAPNAVARSLQDPSSGVSKTLSRTTTAKRVKT